MLMQIPPQCAPNIGSGGTCREKLLFHFSPQWAETPLRSWLLVANEAETVPASGRLPSASGAVGHNVEYLAANHRLMSNQVVVPYYMIAGDVRNPKWNPTGQPSLQQFPFKFEDKSRFYLDSYSRWLIHRGDSLLLLELHTPIVRQVDDSP